MSDYPEAWVTAAAEALAEKTGARSHVRDQARAVLDAVAPTIRAEAWDEGKHGDHDPNCRINGEPGECICANPYREEAQ